MPSQEPEKGDKVSWNWGGGAPGGTVAEKKHEGEVSITSKRGNKIKKNAEPNNPAVKVERSGNDVVKKASELNVESKAKGSGGGGGGGGGKKGSKDEEEEKEKEKKAGDKRKHDDGLDENADGKTVRPGGKTDNAAKKQKKDESNTAEKKKAGRPKKSEGAASKSKKNPTPRSSEGVGSRTRSQKK
ncbi:hypothetical protein RBB50_006195 [Rhinocladiella similis]